MKVQVIEKKKGRINRTTGEEIKGNLRVCAYERVSTEKEEQINSYNSQLKYYEEKIKSNSNWKYVGIYADEGITGTLDYKRDGFMKMMQDATNNKLTKAIDNTRPVISNDGWEHTISDIITIHDYKQDDELLYKEYTDKDMKVLNNFEEYNGKHRLFASGYKYEGQPVIMSEYGGIAINSEEGWGYGKQVKDEKELVERFTKLTKAIKNISYISGYCYTQLTDVQQEINGLMDAERNYKIEPNVIKNINNMK